MKSINAAPACILSMALVCSCAIAAVQTGGRGADSAERTGMTPMQVPPVNGGSD